MPITLVEIIKELRKCTAELKESNDKWEKANEPTAILRPSNDGATPTRGESKDECL